MAFSSKFAGEESEGRGICERKFEGEIAQLKKRKEVVETMAAATFQFLKTLNP